MGYVSSRPITERDEVWTCDDCGQEGIRANGKEITTNQGELVIWFCYNCVQRIKGYEMPR